MEIANTAWAAGAYIHRVILVRIVEVSIAAAVAVWAAAVVNLLHLGPSKA